MGYFTKRSVPLRHLWAPTNRHPMNLKKRSALYAGLLISAATLLTWPLAALAQQTGDKPAATETSAKKDDKDGVLVLSPFVVTTDKDQGYAATNAISGSRVNTAIKDLPIPIQVITSEFISDIGATNLRESLSYVSGIMLQTQNDLGNTGGGGYQSSPYGAGGVNNPEGLTANINQVQLKIRGFVTNNVLRDGFLRANSTDAVNIERIEVVSGPNSLLYGTGNFGGVVDYRTKQPLDKQQGLTTFSYGTNSFMRGALDITGPLSAANHLDYRVGAAVESSKTSIDSQKNSHVFIAPSISWRPNDGKTNLLIDTEIGKSKQNGYGFRALRAVQGQGGTPINNDQIEAVSFYWPPGADSRSFNLSGPDTHNNQDASNLEIKLTQAITEETTFMPEIDLLVGYNHAMTNFNLRGVDGQMAGPVPAGQPGYGISATIVTSQVANSIGGQGTDNANLFFGTLPNTVIKTVWSQNITHSTRDQERFELNFRKTLFAGKWYTLEDQALVGISAIKNIQTVNNWLQAPGLYNYNSPTALTPIRRDKQGDGTATVGLYQNQINVSGTGWDRGSYFNNYAKLFKDGRVILMTGVRSDTINKAGTGTTLTAPGGTPTTTSDRATEIKVKSHQQGISLAITKNLSLYGLKAQGIQPNFNNQHNVYDGSLVGADTAKSKEFGLKFDFMDGKLSGTISHYKITKVAWTGAPWFSPTAIPHDGKLRFDPAKDVVFQIGTGGFNAAHSPGATNFANIGGSAGDYSSTQRDPAIVALWNAAAAAGDIYYKDPTSTTLPTGRLYINASHPAGKAYVDAAFKKFNEGHDAAGWAGWMWDGDGDANNYVDPYVNNATMDAAGFYNARVGENAAIQVTDESSGWDGQILYTPNKQMQFVLNVALGSKVLRVDPGLWAKYPSNLDPWTSWNHLYFGLGGQPITVAYTNPLDTSTHTNVGVPPGDDTPEKSFSLFSNYKFAGNLKGLTTGLGLGWHSKEQYFSGVTHGSGQAETNAAHKPIIAYSPSKLNVDLFAKYTFKRDRREQFIQLNIGNLLDDTRIYGLIYNPPLSAKITYGMEF